MDYLKEVVNTIKILRSPNGCPWDIKQTHQTIRENMLEEAYEAAEAIDENNIEHLKEELGDVLLQVLLQSQIADDNKEFNIQDVAKILNDKLIHRHPHVFSNQKVKDANDVIVNWEKLKEEEKPERKNTLSGIAKTMPAMARALKISKKVTRKGFEWKNRNDVIDCFKSEINEYLEAKNEDERLEEMGDIFFSLINLARWEKIDPEKALIKANKKFIKRFNKLEELAQKPLDELTFEEYDELWQKAKQITKEEN